MRGPTSSHWPKPKPKSAPWSSTISIANRVEAENARLDLWKIIQKLRYRSAYRRHFQSRRVMGLPAFEVRNVNFRSRSRTSLGLQKSLPLLILIPESVVKTRSECD